MVEHGFDVPAIDDEIEGLHHPRLVLTQFDVLFAAWRIAVLLPELARRPGLTGAQRRPPMSRTTKRLIAWACCFLPLAMASDARAQVQAPKEGQAKFWIVPGYRHGYLETAQTLRSTIRPYDNDGDGLLDEDPAEDLDGDGFIRQIPCRRLKPARLSPSFSPIRTSRS
jgi:hypothetical protein